MRFVRLFHMAAWGATVLLAVRSATAANDKRLLGATPSLAAHRLPQEQRDPFNAIFEKASAAQRAKDFDQALPLFQKAAALADPRSHPMSWLAAQFNACHTLNLQGKKDQAADLARAIVAECEKSIGSDDPLTSEALNHLAFVLKQHGRLVEAEPVYHRNVRILEEKYGADHYMVARAVCRHGSLLLSLGRTTEAETQLRRALDIAVKSSSTSADRADLCYFITHLAYGLRNGPKAGEARQLMDIAYSIVQKDADLSTYPHATGILRRLAEYYRDVHQLDRAEELGHQCLLYLARRSDINRIKFFYFDIVADVYRTTLRAKGLNPKQIQAAMQKIQAEAAVTPTTAATSEAAFAP